ncbi:MAG TPA: TAT-variant-translocated molybdopterin oxidoreductase [Verrucomicrobiae bacterium]|nr:TAT-variant-translocated molybdopterin oxidoreductase [Verrucomicrobiae bacterium]
MKSAPHVEPSNGRAYWRGLDELAGTPEFRQFVEREFPEGASEWADPVSRRQFVRLMSASFLLAGLGVAGSGCRRPVERIEPFGQMPENYVHGVPEMYATAMPTRTGAIPVVARSNDGRPTKVEGNALFPGSNGGTDRYAQASVLDLYDPDRARHFKQGQFVTTPAAAMDFLAGLARQSAARSGQGLCFLSEASTSPSRRRLQEVVSAKYPNARWFSYDPLGLEVHRRAASQAFGQSVTPLWEFDKADVVLALDCDFLGSEDDVHNHIRRFAEKRQIETPAGSLNRLYTVEGVMSLTGFNADHRLRVPSSAVVEVAKALLAEIQKGSPSTVNSGTPQLPAEVDPRWITECAKDLAANRGRSLVVAGQRQPLAVHLLAHAMNAALGNLGKTVSFIPAPQSGEGTLEQLAGALNGGQVETLVILHANPVYNAPADLDWAKVQRKAHTVVRLGYYEDETSEFCDWHLPATHYLESWGDAQTTDGTWVPIQPLIAPLFGGWTELEVLARLAAAPVTAPYEIVRETFAGLKGIQDVEAAWRKFLHDGFLAGSASKAIEVKLDANVVGQALNGPSAGAPSRDSLEVVFQRDYSVDDGRYNNNGWLQEMPDPVTKLTWDNAVLLSHKTARRLGVSNLDVVEVKLGGRSVRGPVWVQPGQADYTVALALGYGKPKPGRVGYQTGFDVYPLRTSQAPSIASGATLTKTAATYPLSCTQHHWSMEGRPIVREVNLDQYREHPEFAKEEMEQEEHLPVESPLYPNPFNELKKHGIHQWGMAIDLNRCVGCSACMMACQSENNVPIVGKDQVARSREMHWLRIDRYYSGPPNQSGSFTYKADEDQQYEPWLANPQVVTQPMLCQHCEAAPCENVCPVNATSHDAEGLNVMTYNRCVGTRYCSNNCPYKVRRFNFFDYNKRPLNHLYLGPLAKRPPEEIELAKMVKNPQVTVRMRGVMEKCTYCLQRIEQAKIAQKVKARDSGDVVVPEGTFTTACAQACPAGAIVFGNLKDPNSRVSKLKSLDRNYPVLQTLLTKPRTTYLAKVRNPNPAMPDYDKAGPFTFQNYEKKMGNPFIEHPVEGRKGAE